MAAALPASAQIAWFGSRTAWDAAVGTAPAWSEDFSSFTTDVSFQGAGVGFSGGTLRQVGAGINFRNFVDVPPLATPDNNGTAHASMFVNHGGPGQRQIEVRMSLTSGVAALGFSTWGAASGEGATVRVFSGATLLGSMNLGNGNGQFAGFVLASGLADRLEFAATSLIAGNTGEGFGLDDLVASASVVPEPGVLLGVGVAAIGLAGARRRR